MVSTKKAAVQQSRSESSTAKANGGPILDQDDVMRAMLEAKGPSNGEERDSVEDGSDGDDGSERSSMERKGSIGRTNGVRSSRRSASFERDLSELDTSPASPPSRPSAQASSSRVKLPSPGKPVFDGKPKAYRLDDAVKPPFSVTFTSLGLSQPLISALETINIRKPTEIQAACIRPIMEGRDCIGGAKTGSGKTMAFALPIVERIARDPYGIWAVVLTPTRELAYQLTEQFLVVGQPLGLTTVTIVGGMDMMAQAKELEKRPHIVVATPGRLCDLMRSDGAVGGKLSRVKVLVLDEADRLLTPTFSPELGYLFSQIPASRQTCLFTATISEAIMELANKPPAPGKKGPFVHLGGLKQKYLFIPSQVRDPYLFYLLHHAPNEIDAALRAPHKNETRVDHRKSKKSKKATSEGQEEDAPPIPSTVIFTQRCATAHLLHLLLDSLDIPSVPLHSHLTQPQRLQSLARFRAGEVPVLVTTDVGSRGLDIPEVAMVVNWDCPRRSDDYVHRVGRTARAGRGGVAITIITERDVELVKMIEDEVGTTMVELELPEEAVLEKLNAVSLARRMATMEMHDSGFGERQATNKAKQIKRMKRDAAR